MILRLKGEEMAAIATTLEEIVSAVPTLAAILEGGAEMVVSPVTTRGTTLEVVSLMTLDLKGEEMPTHATALEGSDSDAAACPITTNSLKPTQPTTNAG
jgi:hypothetical protein